MTASKEIIKDKRIAILQSALELIAERGFHGTPMSLVAKRAGVSAGIIYHYFESKDAMIEALYHWIKADFSRAVVAGEPHTLPAPARFKLIWLNAFRYYTQHPQQTRFLEQYENSPYQDYQVAAEEVGVASLLQVTQEDMARGIIKNLPFDVLYELTLGVAIALAKRQIAGAITLEGEMLETIAEACWHAVRQ